MAHAQSVTWDNGAGDGLWSSGTNWSANIAPLITDNVFFPTPVQGTGTVTMTGNPLANSLTFNANYLLSGTNNGTLVLGSLGAANAGRVTVATGVSGTIASPIYGNGWNQGVSGLTKSGNGVLTLSGTAPTFVGGITVSSGTLATPSTAGNWLGNNPLTINAGATFVRNDSSINGIFVVDLAGSGTFQGVGNTGAAALQSLRDSSWFGTPTAASSVRFWFNKYGPGSFVFSPAIDVTNRSGNSDPASVEGGELRLSGTWGTYDGVAGQNLTLGASARLTLDNTGTMNGDRYGNSAGLTFSGGELRYLGNSGTASTEVTGTFVLSSNYASTVTVRAGASANATVTGTGVAALSRNAGSALNVVYESAGSGVAALRFAPAPTLTNNIVSGMFVNGSDFATSTGSGTVTIAAFSAYGTASGGNMGGVSATTNVLVNADQTLAASVTLNALKIDGARAVSLGANNLIGGSGTTLPFMVLKTAAGSANINGTGSIQHSGATNADFIVRVDAGDLTVSSPVDLVGNGSLAKSGTGLLILNPTAAYVNSGSTDAIVVQQGAIRLDPTNANFGNVQRRFAGGVFELTNNWTATTGTGNANVNWLASSADGGFAASGGTRTVSLTPGITWNASNQVANGKALLLNSETADSKIVMSSTINLAGAATELWFREFRVADNPNSSSDFAEITGVISGTNNQAHFLKTGAGRLDIGGASQHTYLGETMVRTGTLNINGVLGAVSGAGSHGLVTAMSTGGVLGGSGTISRPVFIEAGGFLAPGVDGIGILTVSTLAGNVRINGTLLADFNRDTGLNDLLNVAGVLDITNATLNVSLIGSGNKSPFIFAKYTTLVGSTFAAVTGSALPAGYSINYAYNDGVSTNNIALVPEPATIVLAALGFGVFVARRRWRK